MSKDTILCMFSGGVDSSGVLHHLMSKPEYRDKHLIVHHIILQNRENRAQAEIVSVKSIVEYYLSEYPKREFIYTDSVFNTTGFSPLGAERFPFDMDVCAFIAGNICVARKDIRHVAMGRTKTDVDSGGGNFQKRMERAQGIFRSIYSLETEAIPEYIFPVMDKSKQEIWNDLPAKVQAASWYCRHPQYASDGVAIACGNCQTCREVAEFD